jgi:hypothetical protein
LVGVVLYYLAGLLPDPEGPWTPAGAHCFAWVVGALVEIVTGAIFTSQQSRLRVPDDFIATLNILGLARIVILFLMTLLLLAREYRLRPIKPKSVPEERQSLLENGNGSSTSYGSVPAASRAKRTQVSGTGWLDYFAGFRILFPYLW